MNEVVAQIADIPKLAAEMSGQSDRFLFIAALLAMLIGGVAVIRHLVKQNERLMSDHRESRDMHQKALEGIVREQSELTRSMAVVLERNTQALEQNTTMISRSNDIRERAQRQ